MNSRRATVFYGNQVAGRIEKTPDGFEYQYDPNYLNSDDAAPISLGLPLQKERFHSRSLFSFFDGLIPEGWWLQLMSTTLKIDTDDRFSLLLHTGQDTVGAVWIQPEASSDA